MLSMAGAASADSGDFLVGLGVGVIGKALLDSANRNQGGQRRPLREGERRYIDPPRSNPAQDARRAEERAEARRREEAERQEMSSIQERLNALNFDAGTPDGKPGAQTRAAIRAFQASLGASPTGKLSEQQKSMLIASTTAAPMQAAQPMNTLPALDTNGAVSTAPAQPLNVTSQLPAMTSTLPTPGNLPISATGQVASAQAPDDAIFGVKPLQTNEDAHRALTAADVMSSCQDGENAVTCVKQGGQFTDEVVVGTVKLDTSSVVHTAVRTLKFNSPMARSKVVSQLNAQYPLLMSSPDRIASSGSECTQFAQDFRSDDFAKLKEWAKSGRQADENISKLSTRCAYYHEISIPAGETVSSVSIALFSGRPIVNALTEVGSMDGANPGVATTTATLTPAAAPEIPF
jgi:peptidoglycan hydrolase-like protein with peptidoglycan-binding domain